MILELRPDQKFRVVSEPKRLILSGRPRTVVSCTGQIWTWHNSEVRVLANRSMLRANG